MVLTKGIAGSSLYSIQLGVFNQESTADIFLQSLLREEIFVYKISISNHRIFYGLYHSQEEALKDLSLARQLVSGAFVVRLNPKQRELALKRTREDILREETEDIYGELLEGEVEKEEPMNGSYETLVIPQRDGKEVLVYNYSFPRDITFHGFHGVSSVFVKVYEEWNLLEGGFLHLKYSHSIPQKYYGSSLTVKINQTPIYTTFFSSKEQGIKQLHIPLDTSLFKKGFNEVQICTYHRLSDDPCEDEKNPALWVILHQNSVLHLRYGEREDTTLKDFYPYPYVKEYLDESVDFSFIIQEDDINPHVIKAINILSANLGQRVKNKNLKLSVKGIGALKMMEENFILLGTKIPPLLVPFFQEDPQLHDGMIYIGEIPIGHRKVLYILSKEAVDLVSGATLFVHRDTVRQLPQTLKLPVTNIPKFLDEYQRTEYFSLQELGYDNLLLQGGRFVTADYYVNYPRNWKIQEGAYFALKIKYSKALHFSNSLVTVFINSIPIGNYPLTKEDALESIIFFKLPAELLEHKAFHLQIQFFLDGDVDCRSTSDYSFLWSFISYDSYFYLPHSNKLDFTFQDFPAPFVSNYQFQQFSFMFDELLTLEEITLSANMMAYMGNHVKDLRDFQILIGGDLPIGNTILIGTTQQPLIRSINQRLAVPYSDSFLSFRRDNVLLLEEGAHQLATAQLVMTRGSPFAYLFMSSFDPASLSWIGRYFYDHELHGTLEGNVAFVNSRGFLHSFYLGERPREGIRLLRERDERQGIIATRATFEEIRNYLIISVLVILGVILYIIFYRRRELLK